MNEKINQHVNGVFAPYEGAKSVAELKADLLADLQERFSELRAEGKDDETALEMTIDGIGDIEQTIQEMANLSRSLEHQVRVNLNAINLQGSDFAGVTAHNAKFSVSELPGFDFSNTDLTGSSFEVIDAPEANFDGANLTDCNFSVTEFPGASFNKSIFVRTEMSTSDLTRAKFTDVKLIDVKLTLTDLREAIFENCIFNGVVFKYADLRRLRLDGQTFIGVRFDHASLNHASFKGAILKNVSFVATASWTNKYYSAIKTICFDGATMDKLTYAGFKGLGADLSKVTVL